MTLSCNCDMPIDIYADWCQDQGWDCDELRGTEDAAWYWCDYHPINDWVSGTPYAICVTGDVGDSFGRSLLGIGWWGGDGCRCDTGDGSPN